MPANAIPEVDPAVFRQGPAEWMLITAKVVATTTARTLIYDDQLPTTRPSYSEEVDILPAHREFSTRTIMEFYNVIRTNPDNVIQITDAVGKIFSLTSIGKTNPQPILFPTFERPILMPTAFSAAANVAVVAAAADETFTLSQALEKTIVRNREFWHVTLGQPMLSVDEKGVISTNRVVNRQNWELGQPIILTAAEAHLILVGDIMMYTYIKPPVVITLPTSLT